MKRKFYEMALEGVEIPDQVYLPPALNGERGNNKLADIDELRLRIYDECDPLGQLMAIANGMPIVSFEVKVEGGKAKAFPKYETATLSQRIKILEDMREKIIPNMSRNAPKAQAQKEDDEFDTLTRRRSA